MTGSPETSQFPATWSISVISASSASRRNMSWKLLVAVLLFSCAARADPATDAEFQRLESQLLRVQHEQQAVYQQFQMTQELRRTELQMQNPAVVQNSPDYGMNNPPPNYEDVAREKADRDYRIKHYTDEMN